MEAVMKGVCVGLAVLCILLIIDEMKDHRMRLKLLEAQIQDLRDDRAALYENHQILLRNQLKLQEWINKSLGLIQEDGDEG